MLDKGRPSLVQFGRGPLDFTPAVRPAGESKFQENHAAYNVAMCTWGVVTYCVIADRAAARPTQIQRKRSSARLLPHYGTWMSRYGELDTFGLTRTDRWTGPRSADRYRPGDVSEESLGADWLPIECQLRKRS